MNYWFDKNKDKFDWYKKKFRTAQRRSIKEMEESDFRYLSKLFYMNKNMFWKKLKAMNKSDEKVEIEISTLEEQFKELFNTETSRLSEQDKWANAETMVRRELQRIDENGIGDCGQIEAETIEMIISKLQCNKAVGIGGISNEMFKFSGYGKLTNIITYLLNIVIGKQIIPDEFNVGKILRIIKVVNKSAIRFKKTVRVNMHCLRFKS